MVPLGLGVVDEDCPGSRAWALLRRADLEPLGHSTAENFRKGGVHEFGTVVSTVSASGRRASNGHMGLDERYYKLRALNRHHASKS